MTAYSATAPSDEYTAWLNAAPADVAHLTIQHATRIKRLVNITGAVSLLDYYCGIQPAYQHAATMPGSPAPTTLQDYWDITAIDCYDPRLAALRQPPRSPTDGVICAGGLTATPLADVPWLVGDLFERARSFVFVVADCTMIRAGTRDSRQAIPGLPEWWRLLFSDYGSRYPRVAWELITLSRLPKAPQALTIKSVFTSLTNPGDL